MSAASLGRRAARPRHLYRPWVRRLAAAGAVVGVELVVGARTDGFTYFTGLQVPRVLGRHYRVISIVVGGEEVLATPAEATDFASDSTRPPFMIPLRRGTNILVSALKKTECQVPFVGAVLGMERVSRKRASKRLGRGGSS
jgi:hypothetical protein